MVGYADTASKPAGAGTVGFLMRLLPTTVVDAFAKGDVQQVLLFAIQFGLALALIGARGQAVAIFVDDLLQVLFKVLRIVIKLTPLGMLSVIAFTVGKYGVGSLNQLGLLVVLFYTAARILVDAILDAIMRASGLSIVKLLK